MLGYIASNSTANLIKDICKKKNITILNQEVEEIDFLKYIKQTKVNFNLIKYLIIDLSQLKNTEEDVINSIKYFTEMYSNTRVIIIAKGYDNQNYILTTLYENKIYNIINSKEEQQVKEEIEKCLSQEGLQEKSARKFKKIEEVKEDKKQKYRNAIIGLKEKIKTKGHTRELKKNQQTQEQQNSSVYFFAILVESITRLFRLLFSVIIFLLTSIGITILLNAQLREMIFQMFDLK